MHLCLNLYKGVGRWVGVGVSGARVPTGIYGPPNMGMGMKTPVLSIEHQTVLKTEPSSPT